MRTRGRLATLPSFFLALLIGALAGTLVQTQINLFALEQLGVVLSTDHRTSTTLHDLGNFLPVYAVIFGCSFAASQAVALFFTKWTGASWRLFWCTFGAAIGLWVTFKVVDMIAPMPVLIASTRTTLGMLSMLLTAGLAGAVFGRLSAARSSHRFSLAARTGLLLVVTASFSGTEVFAQNPEAGKKSYRVATFTEGLENPWSMAFLPDGSALVTEKPGRLRLISAEGKLHPKAISGIPAVLNGGQAGLFEVLPAPDFAQSRQVFLSYACGTRSANHTCVSSAKLGDGKLENLKEIFRSQAAKSGNAHYGGRMVFMPDNTLVLTLGDGYSYREEAQNLANHLGKIVRINTDGTVPKNNPFAGQQGVQPEIYSYGHRNVQGLVYDSGSRQLIAHEHGPRGGDEVNLLSPGSNYGWPKATYGIDYTGAQISPFKTYEGTIQPAVVWVPSIAPSGMALYNGSMFPQWKGSLLVGALKAQQVNRVKIENGKMTEQEVLFKELGERIRDVRVGPDGAVYLLTDNTAGKVLRVSQP